MGFKGFVIKIVKLLAKLYRRMPIKPFNLLLEKFYIGFINSGIVIKRIDGINYELDLEEAIDNAMYYKGSREPDTSQALKALCKSGHTVIDIGANVGSHSLPIASFVGVEGQVYAFEPVPWAVNKFKRNLELNNINNITLETIALSDINEQEVEMSFRASFKLGSKSGVGEDGKIDGGWWDECEHVKIRMETLDNYVSNHQIDRIDLIKLDVDGFEGKVIRGALGTLSRFKPILIMEVAPTWTKMRGDNMMDILSKLKEIGYEFYSEKGFVRIKNISESIDNLPSEGGFNVIASVSSLV
ncbi:MAG: FkbM family methyltransferase [Marinicellaceae bacterium]